MKGRPYELAEEIIENLNGLPSFADIDVRPELLPKIRWRKPTDVELSNEFKTEHGLETLFADTSVRSRDRESEVSVLVAALKTIAKVRTVDPDEVEVVIRFPSLERMRVVTTSYGIPKDPSSMLRAIFNGDPLPMPAATQRKDGKIAILGGNTRWGFAKHANQPLKVLIFSEREALEKFKSKELLDSIKKIGRGDNMGSYLDSFLDAVEKRDRAKAKTIHEEAVNFAAKNLGVFQKFRVVIWWDIAEKYWKIFE